MAVWSVVLKSKLEGSTRLDPEYYQPFYLQISSSLEKQNYVELGSVALISDGDHAVMPELFDSGKRYLRAKDLQNFQIDNSDSIYISEEYFQTIQRSHIKPNDILLSIMGTIGNIAIVPENSEIMTANRAVAIIRFQEESAFDPYFIAAYLESKIGIALRERESQGGIQQRINLEGLKRLKIPFISSILQRKVKEKVLAALNRYKDSEKIYAQAEALLLHELGLDNLDLSTQKSYVANFSETVESDRLDAEYYNPKYTVLINYLHNIPHSKLGYIASFSNGATPTGAKYLEKGIPFLRIQNIGKNLLNLDDVVYIDKKIHNRILKRSQLQPGDVLITITGRIGTAAVIPDSLIDANMNQHSVRLRIHNNQINPYYLSVFLNSKAGLLQTDRESYGATRDALPYYCLEKIIIPIVSLDLQNEVEAKIRAAEKTLKEAKSLLEQAKHQVEQIILGG
ncbi:restriction endonuclease subunit S [Anabaena sp. WA102]|uniref:restriction endonuclease subunit S n=1 Tax=Anabaena sp. WA102 TaxID=1647413 RepID=UPI0006AC2EF7|nr:restriction endonuclease subunit S [Anabaena sp. WA102]